MPEYTPYYLRDFRLPHKPDLLQARLKFQGYAQFVINRNILESEFAKSLSSAPRTELLNYSTLIRTASLPEVKFKTEVKNQYNRKKIISTGLDYTPVNIKLLDTAWNSSLDLIMRYYAYNYMNVRNFEGMSREELKYLMVSNAENINSAFKTESFNSNLAGYNINNSRYFFERIDYVLYSGQKGIQYSIFNPVMSGFTTGEIDYAANEVLEFDLTFDYENFTVYRDLNFDLSEFDKSRFETNQYVNDYHKKYFIEPEDLGKKTRTIDSLGSATSTVNRSSQGASDTGYKEQDTATPSEAGQDTRATSAQIGNTDSVQTTTTQGVA